MEKLDENPFIKPVTPTLQNRQRGNRTFDSDANQQAMVEFVQYVTKTVKKINSRRVDLNRTLHSFLIVTNVPVATCAKHEQY
jgi:hypothetical protein